MPTTFRLTGCTLDDDAWDEFLVERPDALSSPDYLLEDDGVHHALVVGSVRGALFKREGPQEVSVTLLSFASRMDWLLALSTLGQARLRGGGTLYAPGGGVLGELDQAWIAQSALQTLASDVQALRPHLQEGQGTELPVGESFSLTLRREDLPASLDPASLQGLELRLAAKTQRYGQAFHAPNFSLAMGERTVRLTTWSEECATITPAGADLVSCRGLEPEPQAGTGVPLAALIQALGERAEDVGEGRYFLPSVDWSQEPQLATVLRGLLRSVEDYVPPPPPPAALTGQLGESCFIPVIKPHTWPGASGSLTHPLVAGDQAPLVTYGWDRGDRVLYHPQLPANLQQVHELGVQHLAERAQREGLSWEVSVPPAAAGLGDYRILFLIAEHAPAHLILKPFMLEAQRLLGTSELVAAIPHSHQLLVCEARFRDRFFDLARSNYDDASEDGNQLTPDLFTVIGGQVRERLPNPLARVVAVTLDRGDWEEAAAIATIFAFTELEAGGGLEEIRERVEMVAARVDDAEDFTRETLQAIASLGPESNPPDVLAELIRQGVTPEIAAGVLDGVMKFAQGARPEGKPLSSRKGGGRRSRKVRGAKVRRSRRGRREDEGPSALRSWFLWLIVIVVVSACSCLGKTVERARDEAQRREQRRREQLELQRDRDAMRQAERAEEERRVRERARRSRR